MERLGGIKMKKYLLGVLIVILLFFGFKVLVDKININVDTNAALDGEKCAGNIGNVPDKG